MGWLNRMTQFKEKSSDKKQAASLGLYSYPVLMAADILLYKTKYVPVGDDQKQHLELAREIAGSFNNIFSTNYFNLPEPLIFENVARIMSLRDGTKKMSKSEESDSSRINLIDEDEIIVQKIKKAKTDSVLGFDFHNIKERPEVHNLVSIYSALKNISVLEACLELENLLGMDQFKKNLADLIIAKFAPIRKCYNRLITDEMHYLTQIAKSGAEKANSIAQKTVLEVKEIMGFLV